ncbi:hypothetical protein [Vibrio mediterranei]|uniref:Uncharacterized protein n=2 Tax=Gammaproteobacteria TaxID=1236 RepID=A0ABX5DBP0_9VIBR|nr:hypothetical protein [Vibrio mediterranei]PCD86926.1 hypothetical protein COR52_18595 [Vibrio mediterranei]PRQ66302.1 hypothetical protein COR51_18105 [Vibrio mediterranei]
MKTTKLIPLALALAPVTIQAAYNDAGTDYTLAEQRTHVWNEALEPIELVNSILCFTAQFNSVEFANQGPYLVLADESVCFDEDKSGDSGQSSGASNQTQLMKAVSTVVRESDSDPLLVSVWLPDMGQSDEGEQAIKFKAEIRNGSTDANPFGDFTFNFDFFDNFDQNNQSGGGEVKTISDLDGQIGFTLYEQGSHGGNESYKQCASVVMSEDKTTGVALTGMEYSGQYGSGGQTFALAFNENRVLVQSTNGSFDDLPYKSGDFATGTQCLSRTEFTSHVHRYDLFDATTGAAVELNSGFPIRYDSTDNGNNDSYGFIGYWGLWTESGHQFSNGDTVVKDNDEQQETLTIVTAPGRLIKNTVNSLALTELAGIDFNYWDDDVYQDSSFDQWVVNYSNQQFVKVGKLSWTDNGPSVTQLETPIVISLSYYDSLYMYSEQLGGEVKYLNGEDSITYYVQTFIDGSQSGDAALPNNGTITLTCYDNCPIGTIDDQHITQYWGENSPFETEHGTAYQFTFSIDGVNALTLVSVASGEAVHFDSSITSSSLESTPHHWGLRTGPMVLSSQFISNPWEIYDPNVVQEFYVWETGVNEWNRLTTVRDESGDIVSFDRPIQFSYVHTTNNDRNGDAGDYANQTFMLNYGGNGDLWGIPSIKNDEDDHYRAAFSIGDGVVMGGSSQYVIKAREIEELMKPLATSECNALTLQDPAVAVPTSVTGSADIGSMPEVTGEPSVIAGVTQ